ncbi:MAG: PIN domain-containing protein [Candidatus Woesearchaeota archaeon]|nr:PIN domain-containing protein [Candidatus Woesearchaeota archaeon]
MAKYIFDASAWIEYFEGSHEGKKIQKILTQKKNTVITMDSTVGELFSWTLKRGHNFPRLLDIIQKKSLLHDCPLGMWVEAAMHRHKLREQRKKFGFMDALLITMQQHTGATIVTKDNDFRGLPNVAML